jgi:hypothetical protein
MAQSATAPLDFVPPAALPLMVDFQGGSCWVAKADAAADRIDRRTTPVGRGIPGPLRDEAKVEPLVEMPRDVVRGNKAIEGGDNGSVEVARVGADKHGRSPQPRGTDERPR